MGNSDPHTIAGKHQRRHSSQHLLPPGGQRGSSTRSHTTQDSTGSRPSQGPNATADGYNSHNTRRPSTIVQPARNENGMIASRRAYQHYTARTGQDDPFFSDELCVGMLNGRPNNDHVGSIYTGSQQQEIDAYYRRLMAPRPNSQCKTSVPQTPPPRLRMETANSADGLDLAVGDITDWNPEWSEFVNDDDAKPLLQRLYPDEYHPGSLQGL